MGRQTLKQIAITACQPGMKNTEARTITTDHRFNYHPRQDPGPSTGPRERAAAMGVGELSDLDLVQTLLGSGGPGRPVRQLAAAVLAVLDSSPESPDRDRLLAIPGMGQAKTTLVCGALELARRLWLPERKRIRSPADIMAVVRHYADREQEHFLCLALNGANEVLSCAVVSIGLVNRTLVHPREVFVEAIKLRASSIAVAHNHPSGCLEPSADDREVTRRLESAGELLGITLLDHLIFSPGGWLSFADRGWL